MSTNRTATKQNKDCTHVSGLWNAVWVGDVIYCESCNEPVMTIGRSPPKVHQSRKTLGDRLPGLVQIYERRKQENETIRICYEAINHEAVVLEEAIAIVNRMDNDACPLS